MSILDDHIKNNSVKGLYLLFGDEKYDIERYIEKIKQLWNSNIPLNIISENCGFGCQQYFNK